ncbi:MAG: AAA family ATPase [Gemmatimonas sp.]
MQFSKLRLSGFKSFVDTTELIIEPGLTGIVGPNGCGKSNLIDALRWAMGEHSARQLRGAEMDDIIFAGTQNRPPRNIAEVGIVMDNNDRKAPAQFNDQDEIEIIRRIERGSGTAYKVNGAESRLRDVQTLFADAATGARSTAIVSQGQIGALIAAKPSERRAILEEAAGITGLYSRRHEAELRLKAAEANLTRLEDVIRTLEAQLQTLKKQARQASRYRNLSDHIRRAEAQVLHHRYTAAVAQLRDSTERLTALEAEVARLTTEVASATTREAEAAAALPPLREAEAEAAARLQRLKLASEELDREEERVRAAEAQLSQRLAQIAGDTERERIRAEDAASAIARLDEEAERIASEQLAEDEAEDAARRALDQATAERVAAEETLARLTAEVAAAEARLAELARRRAEAEARAERLNERLRDAEAEAERLEIAVADRAEIEAAEARLADARQQAEAARAELAAAEAEAQRIAEASREELAAAEAEAQRIAEAGREQLAAAEAEAQRVAEEQARAIAAAEADAQQVAEAETQKIAAAEADAQRFAEAETQKIAAAEADAQRVAETARERIAAAEADAQRVAEAVRQQIAAAESDRERVDAEARRRAEEAQATDAMLAKFTAEDSALRNLLAHSEGEGYEPLIDHVSVTPGYETALGVALGDDLIAPVNEAAPIHWRTLPPFDASAPLPGDVRPLSDFAHAPMALARRLSQIGVVETAAEGVALAPQLQLGQRLVSRDGALWRWDGYTVSAGAQTAAAVRLGQRNRLAELAPLIAAAEANSAEMRAAVEAARERQQAAAEAERAAREAARERQQAATDAVNAAREAAREEQQAALESVNAVRADVRQRQQEAVDAVNAVRLAAREREQAADEVVNAVRLAAREREQAADDAMNAVRAEVRQRQQAATDTVNAVRVAARERQQAADAATSSARDAVRRADADERSARETHADVAQKAAQLATKLETVRELIAQLTGDRDEAVAAAEAAQPGPDDESSLAARREDSERAREELSSRHGIEAEAARAHDEVLRQAAARRQRIADIGTERSGWQERESHAQSQIDELESRRASAEEERARLAARPAEIMTERHALGDRIDEAARERQARADALATAEATLNEAAAALKKVDGELRDVREDRVRTEGVVAQATQTLAQVEERVAERVACLPTELLAVAEKTEEEIEALPEAEARLNRLTRERDNMGPVNLRAEEEAKELNEQIAGMTTERDDLVAAIARLRHGINELNREGRERFLAAFEKVNGHFQTLFTRLFGGGRAHLELTEAEDPLEAGLEIMASPPGKKLQVLSLLSGGEKALTTTALLFAVFLTNPAPICVLDEVDAPLDDSNIGRFCNLIEEIGNITKTRFLIVTHHRITMARMDRLYGVTMPERGVSQLVSVDLQGVTRLRAIA